MARMPGVTFLGIKADPMAHREIVCVHTIVGYQSGGNAAHFTTDAGGRIVQARDTIYQSEANYSGNHRVIAIENEDHGPAYNWLDGEVPRFTKAQAEAIARIIVWAHHAHGIPIALVPDSKPGRRGVAYHRQGIDGNFTGPYRGRVAGGEKWSTKFGKVCPGDLRITQLIHEIIPRARELAGMTADLEDDDMTPQELLDFKVGTSGNDALDKWRTKPGTLGHFLLALRQRTDEVEPILRRVETLLTQKSTDK